MCVCVCLHYSDHFTYFVGGGKNESSICNDNWWYQPGKETPWTPVAPLKCPRFKATATPVGFKKVLILSSIIFPLREFEFEFSGCSSWWQL